jgi:hypothetical protein
MLTFGSSYEMMTYRTYFLCFLFCGITTPVHGTSIVAVWTQSEVVIGADSKQITLDVGTTTKTTQSVCKITRLGNLFYAYSGGVTESTKTGFNIQRISEEAFRSNLIILAKAQRFESLLEAPLIHTLEVMRKDNPAYFEKERLKGEIVQMLLVGLENGKLVLSVRGFKIVSLPAAPVQLQTSRRDCPSSECSSEGTYILMGQHEAIDRELGVPLDNTIWSRGLVSAVNRLVSIEISEKSDVVGPPIDILRINKDGAQWIQRKSECVG